MTQNRDASRRSSAKGRGGNPQKPRPQGAKGYPAVPPPKRDQRPLGSIGYPPPVPPPASPPGQPAFVPNGVSYPSGFPQSIPDPSPLEDSPNPSGPQGRKPGEKRLPRLLLDKLAKNWTLWSLLSLTAMGGVGIASAVSLFRIPNLPNCRAIFWPTASATTRIQCAQAYADQGTVEGYLEAIKLVEKLPNDHPLRTEINQRVEDWADRVLTLAEETFHAGKLDEAIGIARRIPEQTAAAGLVDDQIATWAKIWEKAESIFSAAEADLKERKFPDAFTKAIQLITVGNRYWETTKYEELTQLISRAREDLGKLGQARNLARRGTLDSLLEAIKLTTSIESKSPLYGEAQELIKEFGQNMLDLAEDALKNKDIETANKVLKAIPAKADLGAETADFRTIMDAYQLSWQGGTKGLEGAILRLQSIGQDRPLYAKAQSLLDRWQGEVEGRSRLDWAKRLAEPGAPGDLQAAIAEAEKISSGNAVWDEAQDQIDDWRAQIEIAQDRPFLNQAEQLALNGDLPGAVNAAAAVRPGRALYDEAQTLIDKWTRQTQEAEDAPILAQAKELAAAGRVSEAISTASQIQSGRALSSQAQESIDGWRKQLQGQQRLQDAYQFAQRGTLDAIVTAIDMAREVPEESPQKAEAEQAINRWSWDILRLAETEEDYNLGRAIDIARKVPTRTEAYAPAQLKLQEWQALIQRASGSTP